MKFLNYTQTDKNLGVKGVKGVKFLEERYENLKIKN
jgi:hypothetical protein